MRYMSVDLIVVEGCGFSEINGAYKKELHYETDGVAEFFMLGRWEGCGGFFRIWRFTAANGVKGWNISWGKQLYRGEQEEDILFYSAHIPSGGNADLPPKSGWKLVRRDQGKSPAPPLRW